VTFAVQPGEVVALAGPSGWGKSTLFSVLLGLTPEWSGSIAVGDVPLADMEPDAWRAQIAWVPQRPHLFARSVAENVRIGRPTASDDAVWAAIAAADLEQVVARLPKGIETILGHEGAGLSVGERQRVALARAFVRDAPLLLLDEPTANLDGRTEERVLTAVHRLMAGRTVMIAAHRPSLLARADRVVHLAPTLVKAP
jgi:ABC-type multidrug transport system fused ATPase/permease subunit